MELLRLKKTGYPLRPIISQVTTPIYQLTKTINELITPYLSHNYNIKSKQELIEILKTHKPNNGIISSLDVENLFTNVPVLEAIDIINNNIYHHSTLPPLKINSNSLHCTTDLVSMFNGISNSVGYLMPKPFSQNVVLFNP